MLAFAAIALAAGTLAARAMLSFNPALLLDDGSLAGDGRIVVLRPKTWMMHTLPLLRHIDIGNKIAKGKWIVLLYRADCDRCATALPQFQEMASNLKDNMLPVQAACVNIAPATSTPREGSAFAATATWGCLAAGRTWFVKTPCILLLYDGQVIDVNEGSMPDLDHCLEKLFAGAPGDERPERRSDMN
jgi:hypothetical protein